MNLIPIMAEHLGLKIGEKFKIKVDNQLNEKVTFWFTEDSLMYDVAYCSSDLRDVQCWMLNASYQTIANLVLGDYEVVKIPWIPAMGEHYWYVMLTSETDYPQTTYGQRKDNVISLLNLIHHNYFKTQEEAEKNKYEVIKNLQAVYENQQK